MYCWKWFTVWELSIQLTVFGVVRLAADISTHVGAAPSFLWTVAVSFTRGQTHCLKARGWFGARTKAHFVTESVVKKLARPCTLHLPSLAKYRHNTRHAVICLQAYNRVCKTLWLSDTISPSAVLADQYICAEWQCTHAYTFGSAKKVYTFYI